MRYRLIQACIHTILNKHALFHYRNHFYSYVQRQTPLSFTKQELSIFSPEGPGHMGLRYYILLSFAVLAHHALPHAPLPAGSLIIPYAWLNYVALVSFTLYSFASLALYTITLVRWFHTLRHSGLVGSLEVFQTFLST